MYCRSNACSCKRSKIDRGTVREVFVRADGSSDLQKRGDLNDREINTIGKFIKENYLDMYRMWKEFGGGDFYRG